MDVGWSRRRRADFVARVRDVIPDTKFFPDYSSDFVRFDQSEVHTDDGVSYRSDSVVDRHALGNRLGNVTPIDIELLGNRFVIGHHLIEVG